MSGGEDSGARPAAGSIELNSIRVKLTQRTPAQRTLVGVVADGRSAGREIFHEKPQNLNFFILLFIFQRTNEDHGGFFFPTKRRY